MLKHGCETERNITVRCRSGFTDRITIMGYAIAMLNKFPLKVDNIIVYWELNYQCVGEFTNFFKPIPNLEFTGTPLTGENAFDYTDKPYPCLGADSDSRLGISRFLKFKLMHEVLAFVDKYKINECSAVHIRRTDKLDLNAHESQEDFALLEKQMQETDRIFLASDNWETQHRLKEQYGDRVVIYQKIEPNDNKRQTDLRHTLFDLYLLSYCKNVLPRKPRHGNFLTFAEELNMMRNKPTHCASRLANSALFL